jgi:hypothetical protein
MPLTPGQQQQQRLASFGEDNPPLRRHVLEEQLGDPAEREDEHQIEEELQEGWPLQLPRFPQQRLCPTSHHQLGRFRRFVHL